MSTWFSDCEPVDINDKCMVLKTSTDFKRSIIESRFGDEIRRTLSDLFSCDFEIKLLVGEEVEEYNIEKKNNSTMPEIDGYTYAYLFEDDILDAYYKQKKQYLTEFNEALYQKMTKYDILYLYQDDKPLTTPDPDFSNPPCGGYGTTYKSWFD